MGSFKVGERSACPDFEGELGGDKRPGGIRDNERPGGGDWFPLAKGHAGGKTAHVKSFPITTDAGRDEITCDKRKIFNKRERENKKSEKRYKKRGEGIETLGN